MGPGLGPMGHCPFWGSLKRSMLQPENFPGAMADNGDCKALDLADVEQESASSLGLDQAAVLELIDFLAANGYAIGIAGSDDDLSFAAELGLAWCCRLDLDNRRWSRSRP